MLAPPGQVVIDLDGYGLRVGAFDFDVLPQALRRGVTGRFACAEDIPAGRLVCLDGTGKLRLATLPLVKVIGVAVRVSRFNVWSSGDMAIVLRRGVIVPDGTAGDDETPARVAAGGLFVASGGAVLPRARYVEGAVELNLPA